MKRFLSFVWPWLMAPLFWIVVVVLCVMCSCRSVEYVPVEYPSTAEIMADLHELEKEITAGLAELEGML